MNPVRIQRALLAVLIALPGTMWAQVEQRPPREFPEFRGTWILDESAGKGHISGLPVLDKKGRLVGMLTEADLLRRGELGTGKRRLRWLQFFMGPGRLADEYTHEHGRKVEEVMTAEVVTATESTSLQELVDLMSKHGIKRVPVVRDGALVGIVSRADVLRTLSKVFQAQPSYGIRSDEEIQRDVEASSNGPSAFGQN